MADDSEVKPFKFKKMSKLKNKEPWNTYTPDELDEADAWATFFEAGSHFGGYQRWCDFFDKLGVPMFQMFGSNYLPQTTSFGKINESTFELEPPLDSNGEPLVQPRYYLRPCFDIDGNEVANDNVEDMVNENTEINNLLDKTTRDGMKELWYNGKKWKRMGPALGTPGFCGKCPGWAIYVHHVHPPKGADTANELATAGVIAMGGYMVAIAPDNTMKFDDLDKDAKFALGAKVKEHYTAINAKGPYSMEPKKLRTVCEGWLEMMNEWVNYKGD